MHHSEVVQKAQGARAAAKVLATVSSADKNRALHYIAEALEKEAESIIAANAIDLENLKKKESYTKAFYDRLLLNRERIAGMAAGLRDIAALEDPVGEVTGMWYRSGLQIGQVRVPIGVIGIIYEARPNVTVDAAGLTLKSGNAVILRGSSEAINSNKALVAIIQNQLVRAGLPRESVTLIEDTSRVAAQELMRLNQYVDLLIPRGGPSLINTVIENATVPVIQTGAGNCHTYIDAGADVEMAVKIAVNAKVQRPGVCNAMETLLVHADIADAFLPAVIPALRKEGVEIRGCERTRRYSPEVVPAQEEDWETEYLDLILAVKVVDSLDEAIEHINRYSTQHSEAIVTENYHRAREFLNRVDSAAVYVNASTRFTDGGEFGLGAEMGISTQKLHVRGPMGLKALTSLKYIIYGAGQVRQ
ncbi:MAG: glutamate-5-semialdehyde dehydrogenase [Dethiobacteria bacterium]|jgi:glutamate-5-semialdehyde dehydrogenase|nr:glutamate-5-semialdehyde dehydrogenase [Bacillota bacterium]HOP69402.1 glutamate-5-semialdehyde dehydrogenase [Bacillota bacterium]HPT34392.1 glutamate-5-semialdehyde dehydrogenase [Bacillota bacterium]HPZ64655.1 glutamate-5-semialdehyde dehydrogenase [Bacillota bacterium]HQD06793.1 glutamate-5-semialdehyde dehydrogenase [Bacillota bacterium]